MFYIYDKIIYHKYMNKIPIVLLESFIAFAESANMRDAADKLGLSQPALSQHLKKLQDHLPYNLFMLKGKKKILTPYGVDVLESIKKHISQIPSAVDSVNNKYKSPNEITIRISGRLEILRRLMEHIQFTGSIEFISSESDPTVQDLLDRTIDIAISKSKPDSHYTHSKPLLKDQFILIYPKKWNYPADGLNGILSKLKNRQYIGYSEKLKNSFDFLANTKMHRAIEDWEYIINYVQSGHGWAVVPSSFLINEKYCEKTYLRGYNETQFYILYSKENIKYDWFKDIITSALNCFKR